MVLRSPASVILDSDGAGAEYRYRVVSADSLRLYGAENADRRTDKLRFESINYPLPLLSRTRQFNEVAGRISAKKLAAL
jgi:hypothetical protein